MIYFTNHKNGKIMIGLQKSSKHYTFLHWLDHSSLTSRYRLAPYRSLLKEYQPIGPTLLVEWADD